MPFWDGVVPSPDSRWHYLRLSNPHESRPKSVATWQECVIIKLELPCFRRMSSRGLFSEAYDLAPPLEDSTENLPNKGLKSNKSIASLRDRHLTEL